MIQNSGPEKWDSKFWHRKVWFVRIQDRIWFENFVLQRFDSSSFWKKNDL